MSSKEELLKRLSDGVLEMEEDDVAEAAQEYLDAGYPAFDGIMEGLVDGMNRASELYEQEEYFVTDVLLCSDAMYIGLDILRPYLPDNSGEEKVKAVIGVVEGDTHDIGKNLVAMMIESAGFEVIDLGVDVSIQKFIDAVNANPDVKIVGCSALLTTTMPALKDTVAALNEAPFRKNIKVMVGGAPITQEFADEIGADAYTPDAASAAQKAKELAAA